MFVNNRWILICLFSLFFLMESKGNIASYFTESISYNIKKNNTKTAQKNIAINLVALEDFIKTSLTSPNPMRTLYKEPVTQWLVEDFLTKKIKSEEIVKTVLLYTMQRDLDIKIVFSLVFVESSFSNSATNKKNKNASQDFGLFQINSKTFRHLEKEEFFHLETNVKLGTQYLQYAFGFDPDPQVALAIYNAGPSRPLRGETPESTKKYVKKILAYSDTLEKAFVSFVWTKLQHAKEKEKDV